MDNGKFNNNDVKYELCVPPLGLNFAKMKPGEAKENFDWFIKKIPERIRYLILRCSNDIKVPHDILDLSQDSLIPIWRWFIKTARIEKTPKKEIEVLQKQFAHLGNSFINKERLSISTEFMLRDIGMYLGEVFTRNFNKIKWDFYIKPKRDFFVNRPLLTGFIDTRYDSPFHTTFEPVHMAGVQAANMLDNTQDEKDLYNLVAKWLPYVNKLENG